MTDTTSTTGERVAIPAGLLRDETPSAVSMLVRIGELRRQAVAELAAAESAIADHETAGHVRSAAFQRGVRAALRDLIDDLDEFYTPPVVDPCDPDFPF